MTAILPLKQALSERYSIEREIGRGGMATVYLARDVRHERLVALKVLDPELGAVLGTERFLAEIKVTANLQHPNLLPLFDSGEAAGLLYYVMPYVEGESLRSRLEREKQLPIEEALHIATAVASALEYAHQHGVIHRDLKPENILLQAGQPVVADFGIALAVSRAGGARITQTGLSLGTPQYMSPEQATGDRVIDARSDIYSVGAVLYEMLTGEPPHSGTTAQAIIAKVLTDKPRPIHLTRETVPGHIESAVERALAKLPADRFATAREFAEALGGRSAALPGRLTAAPAQRDSRGRRARWRAALPWTIAGAAVALAVVTLASGRATTPESPTIRIQILAGSAVNLLPTGFGNPIAVSPYGRHVAYIATGEDGARRLYLRSADDLQARVVPESEFARLPFFSPDGQWVGFWAEGQLKKAPVDGGAAMLLTELPVQSRFSWSPSGQIVMTVDRRLAVAPASGGAPRVIATLDSATGETGQAAPVALPDGNTVLYASEAAGGPAAARIGVASLGDGSTTILDIQGSYPLGLLDDYLIYSTAGGAVMAVEFDLGRRRVIGVPVPVIDLVATEAGTPQAHVDLSADGNLVYVSGLSRRQLMLTNPAGATRPLMSEIGAYRWPRVSPDGRRVALTQSSSSRSDIWIYDLPAGPLTRLTREGTTNDRAEWMPDSRSLVYRSNRGGLNAMWTQPVDGASPAQLLFGLPNTKVDQGIVSPDGRYLLYQQDLTGRGELWFRALAGDPTPRRVGSGSFGEVGGRFSPDGKWVVYGSSESGSSQIYVRPFPSLAARYQVSLSGGSTPLWTPDGKRILYVVGREVIAATIGSTAPFTISRREPVFGRGFTFTGIHADYDVMKDGSFIAFRAAEQDAQAVAVYNWGAELRRRMQASSR